MIALNLSTTSVVSDSYYNTLRLGFIYFFVGLYLLRGAPLLINYAFPNKQNEVENKDTKETVELQN